jgi:hypothetical protein
MGSPSSAQVGHREVRKGSFPVTSGRVGLALFLILSCFASPSWAKPAKRRPQPRTVVEKDWASAPSAKYGAMTAEGCLTELRARKVEFTALENKPGVLIPVRLKGSVRGVAFRTELPAEERKTTPYEVMDCRLALAVDDLAAILAKHEIAEVHIFSAWRPPAKGWPAAKEAARHPGGLALDIRRFVKKSDDRAVIGDLVVERDWRPQKSVAPCPVTEDLKGEQRELRQIFCEARDARIFTSMLSPNYDADHKNHFHLEIRPRVKWRIVL